MRLRLIRATGSVPDRRGGGIPIKNAGTIGSLSLRAEESPEKVKGTMKCDLLVALTNQKRPHRAFKDSVPEILFLVFTRDSFFPH
jgi:hypothetical protein